MRTDGQYINIATVVCESCGARLYSVPGELPGDGGGIVQPEFHGFLQFKHSVCGL